MPNVSYDMYRGGGSNNQQSKKVTPAFSSIVGNALKNAFSTSMNPTVSSGVNNSQFFGPVSGNSGYSENYSSSSSGGNNPYTGYADQLKTLYEQQQSNLASYQQQQRNAAQQAYNNNMSALQNAYNSKISNLDSSLQNAKDQLSSQYGYSKDSINSDAAKAMQEAYVNRMLSQKNLQQQLTAQGLSGGASESAISGLINNYGNARNEIDTTRNDNLASLEQTYNSNLADVLQNYYNAKNAADESRLAYQMQLENALANDTTSSFGNLYDAMASLDTSYLSAMQNALANQAAYEAKANKAINTYSPVNTGSTGSISTPSDIVRKKIAEGSSVEDVVMDLGNQGYNSSQIAQYFAQAGINLQ